MSARKKNRRKKTTRAAKTVAASTPVAKTPVDTAPVESSPVDEGTVYQTPPANPLIYQFQESRALLYRYGFSFGRPMPGDPDIIIGSSTALYNDPNFRRRPLTTILTDVTPDGLPFADRVFIDEGELTRTTVDDLTCFITEAAERAGTADQLSDIVVMLDPGSTTTGSLRYTINQTVRDHSFDLDPGFGDAQIEAEILQGVAPYGYDAFTFYAAPAMKPVTIWIPTDSDDKLIEALKQENEELPVAESAETEA